MKNQARFVIKNWILSMLLLASSLSAGEWIADPKSGCKVWNENPVAGENISWNGVCRNGFANGRNYLTFYIDGKVKYEYLGSYINGKMKGKGKYTMLDGYNIDGNCYNGKLNGKVAIHDYRRYGPLYFIDSKQVSKIEYEKSWSDVGISLDEVYEWSDVGFSAIEAKKWNDIRFVVHDVMEWESDGFTPSEAKAWKDAGFSSNRAVAWKDAGFSNNEAIRWEKADVGVGLAVARKEAGITPEAFIKPEFKTLREENEWNERKKSNLKRMEACYEHEKTKLQLQYLVTTDDTKDLIERKFQKYKHDFPETDGYGRGRVSLDRLYESIRCRNDNSCKSAEASSFDEKHFCLDPSKNNIEPSVIEKDKNMIGKVYGQFAGTLPSVNTEYYKRAYENFDAFKAEYIKSKTKVNSTQQKLKAKY
jgi:hypothetical protein